MVLQTRNRGSQNRGLRGGGKRNTGLVEEGDLGGGQGEKGLGGWKKKRGGTMGKKTQHQQKKGERKVTGEWGKEKKGEGNRGGRN